MNSTDIWILLALLSFAVALGFAVTSPCMEEPAGCSFGSYLVP